MDIPLKITITRKGEIECMRRVTLYKPSLQVLSDRVKEWVKGNFELKYLDDEGDMILMESNIEWNECIRIWKATASGPLRLEVKKVKSQKHSIDEKQQSSKSINCSADETDAIIQEVLDLVVGSEMKMLEAGYMSPSEYDLESWLTVTPSLKGNALLRANLSSLNLFLSKKGHQCLDSSDFTSAVKWFQFGTRLSSAAVCWYNLACSHSLNSSPDHALEALKKSLELGYKSFDNIVTDTDLEAIKSSPQFSEIMSQFFPDKVPLKCEEEDHQNEETKSLRLKYSEQLFELRKMGFDVDDKILFLLQKHDGLIGNVISDLLM